MLNSSIYIHVPWCKRRCPYCNFYFVVGQPASNFVDALFSEYEARASMWHQGIARSLYLGGGTPSLLPSKDLNRLILYFQSNGLLSTDAEITLEANPEDIDAHKANELLSAGVNRISLGVQSFDSKVLRQLGRRHTGDQAQECIAALFKTGFNNISIDLIVGVMDEGIDRINRELDFVIKLGIPHVSVYLLTIEENTNFYARIKKGVLKNISEDEQVNAYNLVQKSLLLAGYIQYDVSSYARPSFLSRHNQMYWGKGSYIGLGPGAHSMRFLPDGRIERGESKAILMDWLKDPKDTKHYLSEVLDKNEALLEALAFGMRNMAYGIDPATLAKRHQTELPRNFFVIMKKFKETGWIEENNGSFRITHEGALFADAIMRDILSC